MSNRKLSVWKDVSEFLSNPAETTALVRGLTVDNNYYFRVAAVNKYGRGEWSEKSAVFVVTPEKPDPPAYMIFKAPKSGDSGKIVSVKIIDGDMNGAPIVGYELRFEDKSNGTTVVELGNKPDFVVLNLKPGTMYSVTARTKNSVGYSDPSKPFEYKTQDPEVCAKSDFIAVMTPGPCATDSTRKVEFVVKKM